MRSLVALTTQIVRTLRFGFERGARSVDEELAEVAGDGHAFAEERVQVGAGFLALQRGKGGVEQGACFVGALEGGEQADAVEEDGVVGGCVGRDLCGFVDQFRGECVGCVGFDDCHYEPWERVALLPGGEGCGRRMLLRARLRSRRAMVADWKS